MAERVRERAAGETGRGGVWEERMGGSRVKSTSDPDTFEKYRDAPPISISRYLLQKYAFLFVRKESILYIHHQFLYHDPAPVRLAILLQKY